MFLFWSFLLPFSDTNEFIVFCAEQLPVNQIGPRAFSPYHPIISLMLLGFYKTLAAGKRKVVERGCSCLGRFSITLEDASDQMAFRSAYLLFPFLDIIVAASGRRLVLQSEILPLVLFLLGYTPEGLLRTSFGSLSEPAKQELVRFLGEALSVCIARLTETQDVQDGVFHQLTGRVCRFLIVVIRSLGDCLVDVLAVVRTMVESRWQHSRNFVLLFDLVSRLIRFYDCQSTLIACLLRLARYAQHETRCFATSLLVLIYKADFDRHASVVLSSLGVLGALTSLMLSARSQTKAIPLYRLVLERIRLIIPHLKNELFVEKLDPRLTDAIGITDTIEKMRAVSLPNDERIVQVLSITRQYNSYPSMKIRWLKEVVQLDIQFFSHASAFVAQLHICVLIAAVMDHQRRISGTAVHRPPCKEFNLVVTQPLRFVGAIVPQDFGFIPSVLEEAMLNFDKFSDDFKCFAADFTTDYLAAQLEETITLGLSGRMFYSLRPLLSMQLRLSAGNYARGGEVYHKLSELYGSLSANGTTTHCVHTEFFVVDGRRVYTVDEGCEDDFRAAMGNRTVLRVWPGDRESGQMEHLHCWDSFRTRPGLDEDPVSAVEYRTATPLPCLVMYSEVVGERKVTMSLGEFAVLEGNRSTRLMVEATRDLEQSMSSGGLVANGWKWDVHRQVQRIEAVLETVQKLLTVLSRLEGVKEVAARVYEGLARLTAVYGQALEQVGRSDAVKKVRNAAKKFRRSFSLQEVPARQKKIDPVTEKFDYE
jgi:hypothetical protein